MIVTAIAPEFFIEWIVAGEGGRFTVIGRCGDAPIRVGDRFDLTYRNKKRKYPEEANDDPVRLEEKPASLRVVCIHAYEQSLRVLGQAMTGSLVVEGEGLDHLAAGWVIGSQTRPGEVPAPSVSG